MTAKFALFPECGANPPDWVGIAAGHLRDGDLRGALLAVDRHVSARPAELSPLVPLLAELCRHEKQAEFGHVMRSIVDSGAEPAALQALCEQLFAAHPTGPDLSPYLKRAERCNTEITKMSRDWSRAVLQCPAIPVKDRPGAAFVDTIAAALRPALDGNIHAASVAIARLRKTDLLPFVRERLDEVGDLLQRLEAGPAPDRAILDDTPRDVSMSDSGSSKRLAVVFTGLAERVSGLPVSIFDRLLAQAGFRSLFLRDPSRHAFACGINSVAPSARGTIETLQALINTDKPAELLIIGTSGGGYASLRYGLELGADRIVVVSGGTVCRPEDLAKLGDGRVPVVSRRTVERAGPDDFTAPVHKVLGGYAVRPAITLHFADGMANDRAHAMLLDGQDGVRLRPYPGTSRHNIIMAVLDEILSEAPKPV